MKQRAGPSTRRTRNMKYTAGNRSGNTNTDTGSDGPTRNSIIMSLRERLLPAIAAPPFLEQCTELELRTLYIVTRTVLYAKPVLKREVWRLVLHWVSGK